MAPTEHAPSHEVRPGRLFVSAAWFGLVVGLLEVAYQAYRKLAAHDFLWVSRDFVWMAPVADALFCVALGVLIALVAALTRSSLTPRIVAFVFTAFAATCFMMQFETLHVLAVLAISLGLGIQAGRVVAPRPELLQACVNRTLLPLALLIGLLSWTEGSWMGRIGPTTEAGSARADAPNVVIITMDTVRAQSLGLYGYERPTTPRMTELAARGVKFERVLTTAPWTLPTHASIFTGRFPHELSVSWLDPLDQKWPTLADALHRDGYATGGFVANLNYCGYESGLDRGFAHYDDYPRSLGQLVLSSAFGRAVTNSGWFRELWGYRDNLNRKTAADLNGAFLSWVDGVEGQPFFAFLNYYDAHSPYLPPPEFEGRFGPVVPRGEYRYETNMVHVEWEELSSQQLRMENDSYDAAIAYLDEQIGQLVESLEQRGVLDRTLFIVTADHGEQFGEHGLFDHGNSLYLENIKAPLLMLLPGGARAGEVVEAPVTLRDLPATVLELVGASPEHGLAGASLTRWWGDGGGDPAASILLSELELPGEERHQMKSLLAGPYHYVRNIDGAPELYDIEDDPEQLVDLSSTPEGREAVARYEEALKLILAGSR